MPGVKASWVSAQSPTARPLLFVFALASFTAVTLGCVALAAGTPASSWVRNALAWAAGTTLGALLATSTRAPWIPNGFLVTAPLLLAATLVAPGQEGVHRWIDIGSLHVNVAAVLLPVAVVALAFQGLRTRLGLLSATAIEALLLLQPDASHATAFAAAVGVLLTRDQAGRMITAAGLAGATLLVAAAWWRPNPLEPVPEVEGIFALATQVSPYLGAAAAFALAAASLAPLLAYRGTANGTANGAWALAAYFTVIALAPALGAFPVPLVGLGMSFPIGHWLAVGLLASSPTRNAV